jgi:hypothetical protein
MGGATRAACGLESWSGARVSEPMGGDDDFFAIQVTEGLDDDGAILVIGDHEMAVEFRDLAELLEAIESRKPIEVRLSQVTHDRLVAELARQGVHPNKIQ